MKWQSPVFVVLTGVLTGFAVFSDYASFFPESDLPPPAHVLHLRNLLDEYQDDNSKLRISVLLTPGDRLIISSLDQKTRLHEVVVSRQTPEYQTRDDIVGPFGSGVDFARVPSSRRDLVRPCDQDSGIGTCSGTRIMCVADRLPAVQRAQVFEVPRSERRFLLPRFTVKSSTSSDYSERIVVCQETAATDTVRLYTAELTLPARISTRLLGMFEETVIPAVMEQVGTLADVDRDNHLSVVVCELSDGLIHTENPLWGCVRAADFLSTGPFCGDIIYLDRRLLHSDALPAVIMHELTHAAVFSVEHRLQCEGRQVYRLSGWLNEAIAHSCEYRVYPTSPNLADRISGYVCQSGFWPLIFPPSSVSAVSSRGPMRAAGLFYVEFIRQTETLPEFIERELLMAGSRPKQKADAFAELFRQWTVWMSERQQYGEIPLNIGELPREERANEFVVRGTAATWWEARHAGEFMIQAGRDSALQVTVINPQN